MPSATQVDELFGRRDSFPDPDASDRLEALIGIDEQKRRLEAAVSIMVAPDELGVWFKRFHPYARHAASIMSRRPALVVLCGDVGCGKTALAENIGDAVARSRGLDITLLPLSLSSRGQGRVGEMTQLISSAFDYVLEEGRKSHTMAAGVKHGLILLIDEADALGQSREEAQMHHEDRAGVNALIRGIDYIANARVPVAVIMCTNRFASLDPAIRRRAADILTFGRPDASQRLATLERLLYGFGFAHDEIQQLVDATGPTQDVDYGFTFSDLTQRLLPAVVLDAYPKESVNSKRAVEIGRKMAPTRPFMVA